MSHPLAALDEDALRRNAEAIRRLARSLVFDEQQAEDVAQETMRIAMEEGPKPRGPLGGWLAGVARNVARRMLRGEGRRRRWERAAGRREAQPSAAQLAQRVEEQRRVLDAVLRLEEPYRSTVVLRYFEDVSAREIAAIEGIPVETVRTHLKRAVERLRADLDRTHGGDRRIWCLALLPLAAIGGPTAPVPSLAGGAFAMKKAVWIAAILLTTGLGTWGVSVFLRPADPGARGGPPSVAANAAGPTLTGRSQESAAAGAARTEAGPPVDLAAVDRDRDLHGVVVTREGKPVAGALLTAVEFPWQRSIIPNGERADEEVERGSTRSAKDGAFAIRLTRGADVHLRVSAPEYAEVEIPGCQAGQRVKVVMAPGVRLLVSARAEGGQPVEAVHLRLWVADGAGRTASTRRGTTDGTGSHAFDGLPPGWSAGIWAQHDTLGETWVHQIVLPSAGELREDLVVPAGRTLRGRVTDAATGLPIRGARVGSGPGGHAPVDSDADGRYVFPGWVGKGVRSLAARANGYGLQLVVVGEAGTVDISMQRGFIARGRTVDASGRAVGRARISANGYGGRAGEADEKLSMENTTSDPQGRFNLGGLRGDLMHTLVVMADGFGKHLLDFDPPPTEQGVVELGDIVLAAPREIGGRVIDAGGQGIADVRIELWGANADRDRLRPGKKTPYLAYGVTEERTTDDLGRFRFPDLAPGTYAVKAGPDGPSVMRRSVALPADRDVVDVDFRVGAGHEVVVTVEDDSGKPLANANVEVWDESGGGGVRAKTDAAGKAKVITEGSPRSAQANVYSIEDEPFLRGIVQTIAPGQTEVRLVVERAGSASGQVVDADGKPLAGAAIDVLRGGVAVAGIYSGDDGRFVVAVPAKGTATLVLTGWFTGPSGSGIERALEGQVDGVAAGATDLTIRARPLRTDRSLSVLVLAPDGMPASGARVHVSNLASATNRGAPTKSVAADATGRVRLTDLAALPFRIDAFPGASANGAIRPWPVVSADGVVPDGQEVVLKFHRGWLLQGVVVDPRGGDVANLKVTIHSGDEHLLTTTSRDGRFALTLDAEKMDIVNLEVISTSASGSYKASLVGIGARDGPVTLTLAPVR